ncbi:hypothetical protein P7K49_004301 [Saguinus oedipus]|uniref:Uncharacterized protein n=1 Tax=Saguinus oedipus TaxID=9490 RepID=A0ABQ9W7E8_SAGOE|nr:hypothetical protein P7K49_004301 [Saguinus oedipus]
MSGMVLMLACLSPKPLPAHFTNAQDGADASLFACQFYPSSITPYDFIDAQDDADAGLSDSQCCPSSITPTTSQMPRMVLIWDCLPANSVQAQSHLPLQRCPGCSITPHHFTNAQDNADVGLSASHTPHHFTNAQDCADVGLSASHTPHHFTNAQDCADVGLSASQCSPSSITQHHFTNAQDGGMWACLHPVTHTTSQKPRMVLMWACLLSYVSQAKLPPTTSQLPRMVLMQACLPPNPPHTHCSNAQDGAHVGLSACQCCPSSIAPTTSQMPGMVLMPACLSPKPLPAHFTNAKNDADVGLFACQCYPSSITPYDFIDAQDGADASLSDSQCCPSSITPTMSQMPGMVLIWDCLPANSVQDQSLLPLQRCPGWC